MIPRLLTIPISHYGERARWALDHAEIDYQEEHHLQMFSGAYALANGGRHTVPVLVLGSRALDDSALIVRGASERARAPLALYPKEGDARREIARFEADLAEHYGVDGRLAAYEWFFRCIDLCLPYNQGRAPEFEGRVFSATKRIAEAAMRRRIDLSPAAVNDALDSVNRTLDAVAERLSDGRKYLFGDTFTAADLTFAALSGPNVVPLQFPVPLPQPEEIPEDVAARVKAWRAHPAGQFALRLYEERPATRGRYVRDLKVKPRG